MMMKFSHRICFKHPDLLFGVFVFLTESVLSIQTCSLVYLYLCICVFVFLTESVLSIQTCSLGFLTILPRRRCSTSILRKAICSGKRLGILPKVLDLVLHSPSLWLFFLALKWRFPQIHYFLTERKDSLCSIEFYTAWCGCSFCNARCLPLYTAWWGCWICQNPTAMWLLYLRPRQINRLNLCQVHVNISYISSLCIAT